MIQKRWQPERSEQFAELVKDMEQLSNFSADEIKAAAERFMEKYELKFGDVLPMLRLAQAGTMKGPAIFEMMELLGKEEAVARLKIGFEAFDRIVQS
jgi:glutamyl-tRNA synthetase